MPTCPKCGAEVAATSLEGLCPKCVAKVIFPGLAPATGPGVAPQPGTMKIPVEYAAEAPGTRISHYKLLEKIGEGGFGVVYMAEQEEPIRRRVAIKIIKLGMDTREVIARFEAERQALALMDHPNIARVLDAGATEKGRPFFVMELVRGTRITTYCDENNLSPVERLKLFTKVCHAIQHAHQKGIIHRDIKPSNVLVTLHDGDPVPKVIDFGIAKALGQKLTDKTLFTGFNQMIGTPVYMSPEQAEMSGLDIDTRSDVYSLGVLLYELLTGTTPFETEALAAAAFDEMRRLLRETDPPKPSTRLHTMGDRITEVAKRRHTDGSTLSRLVEGDLDWIVMKCLEKDRGRRYETANSLALDVENHMSDQPVVAAAPSAVYRARKFVRRHKTGIGLSAVAVALLAVGTIVSTWQAIRATRAERETLAEAAKSAQIAQFLSEMLQGVGPSVALGRDTAMLKEILDKTAERVGRDLTNHPDAEAELRKTLGNVYSALSLYTNAESMQRKVLELRTRMNGARSPQVAKAMNALAMVLREQGRLNEAETMQRQALALQTELLGANHADVAGSMNDLANVLSDASKNLDEAFTLQSNAVRILRISPGDHTADIALGLNNLAAIAYRNGKPAQAVASQREALALQVKTQGTNSPDYAQSLNNLSVFLAQEGKLAEAESAIREALSTRRRVLGDNHAHVATSLNNLSSLLWRQQRFEEAEARQLEAIAMYTNRLGLVHPEVAVWFNNLGTILQDEGKFNEAESVHRTVMGIQTNLHGAESRDLTISLHNLGRVLCDAGRLEEAERMHRDGLAMQLKLIGEDHPHVGFGYHNLAVALCVEGKFDEAETNHLKGLAVRRKVCGNEHPDVMQSLNSLGLLFRERKDFPKAETHLREGLAGRRKAFGDQHPLVGYSLENLALVLIDQNRFADAEPFARECLSIREKTCPGHWRMANAQVLMACVLYALNKPEDAQPLMTAAYETISRQPDRIPADGKKRARELLKHIERLRHQPEPARSAEWQKVLGV